VVSKPLALATFGWGWHLDAATAALRLILRGTFDQQPTQEEINSFLGHFSSETERQKFSSANAAALYGLDI
jgi:hypothetical protein